MPLAKIREWITASKDRKNYCTLAREPFYQIAGKYIASVPALKIVDIGAGDGSFVSHITKSNEDSEVYLLDANPETVDKLAAEFGNVVLYKAPDTLPFDDSSIDLVHCSHLVEHLTHGELYRFLGEINRVLKPGGLIIISAPLLWDNFYNDMSHIKPYSPAVFINYLTSKERVYTNENISTGYTVVEVVYRYHRGRLDEGWGSEVIAFDIIIRLYRSILYKLGFRKYYKNGFTIVLKKG